MKTIVTGGSGLVGTYLKKIMPDAIYLSSKDYDLTKENDIQKLFKELKPEVIIHLAAKVGGIMENIKKPAEFFTNNVLMNTLLLDYSYKNNVKRFIGILSTCIYPDKVLSYPMTENDLHAGPPAPTNFSYGYAKRALAVQIDAYNQQYGTSYQYLIPCNLYGSEAHKDADKNHYVTSLVSKISYAQQNNLKKITLFGDGSPLRQFMHAQDLAQVISDTIKSDVIDNFNVATDENVSILEIAKIALSACDAEHLEIEWDTSKPNGQYRKDVSIKKLQTIFPQFKATSLFDGIKSLYHD